MKAKESAMVDSSERRQTFVVVVNWGKRRNASGSSPANYTMIVLFITIIALILIINAFIFLLELFQKEFTWVASSFVSKQPTFLILNLFYNKGFPKSACSNANMCFFFGCN